MKILVVDDEAQIRLMIREYAEFEGIEVDEAADGMEAVKKVREGNYDLIIMDIMMPKLDGFSACKEIRKSSNVPIIMLSARGEEYDQQYGFELGIDDYVVKPFSPKLLIARIKTVCNRYALTHEQLRELEKFKKQQQQQLPERMSFEGLEIDMKGREVYVNGQKASMTPKEYDLLFYLVKNRNIALTRDKLLEEVWGYDFFGDDRTVDTHIKMLRNSLEHVVVFQ